MRFFRRSPKVEEPEPESTDTGVATTQKILDEVRERVEEERISDPAEVQDALKQSLVSLLNEPEGTGRLWGRGRRGGGAPGAVPLTIRIATPFYACLPAGRRH